MCRTYTRCRLVRGSRPRVRVARNASSCFAPPELIAAKQIRPGAPLPRPAGIEVQPSRIASDAATLSRSRANLDGPRVDATAFANEFHDLAVIFVCCTTAIRDRPTQSSDGRFPQAVAGMMPASGLASWFQYRRRLVGEASEHVLDFLDPLLRERCQLARRDDTLRKRVSIASASWPPTGAESKRSG